MKPVIAWLLAGCFLIFIMVIVGGITRLTHSGLSMVEWNLILGAVSPMNEAVWQETFEKYKQFPEYKALHTHFTLSDFKSIFWWEYIHRMIGRLLGIVFIVPFITFLLKKRLSSALIKKCLLLFLLGAFQGFLGWFMVKSGLVDLPRVSHYRLAVHLTLAFVTFGFTVWIALDLIYTGASEIKVRKLKNFVVWLLGLVVVQILFVPVSLGVLHPAGAFLLFGSGIYLLHRV